MTGIRNRIGFARLNALQALCKRSPTGRVFIVQLQLQRGRHMDSGHLHVLRCINQFASVFLECPPTARILPPGRVFQCVGCREDARGAFTKDAFRFIEFKSI